MVRTEVFLHEPQMGAELPTSQILPVMLVVSLSLVLLRAAVLTYHLYLETDDTGDPSGKSIPRGVPFFVAALANVLIRLGSATGHGLLAINWVLAGAEPGMQLVACFVLVSINTHMLSSVALVVHLRSLLAAVAICHQSRVKFQGISHLWGAPAGIACLALNGLSTAILLAHLYERPERIVTWLATAAGFLLWANSIVYGSPYLEKEVLIIDAKNHKNHMRLSPLESIYTGNWRFSPTVKETSWTDLIAVEGHLFFAPGGDGEPVIMDPKFSNFWTFPEEETSMPMQQMPKKGIRKQGRTQRAHRAPARQQRMTKRPGKAQKSYKGGNNRKTSEAELTWQAMKMAHRKRGDQEWKRADRRTPIEKVRRTIVSLGNKLILSPGNSKHLLIVNLLSGINTTVEEDDEVLSVRQRLDKQLEEEEEEEAAG